MQNLPPPPGRQTPGPEQRVTLPDLWAFFLVVIVAIVAGFGVECWDAVQAAGDSLPWHRHR
jgi:hypothetical protein